MNQIYNIVHCCQPWTVPWPQMTRTEIFLKFGHLFLEICERTDKQNTLIAILCALWGQSYNILRHSVAVWYFIFRLVQSCTTFSGTKFSGNMCRFIYILLRVGLLRTQLICLVLSSCTVGNRIFGRSHEKSIQSKRP